MTNELRSRGHWLTTPQQAAKLTFLSFIFSFDHYLEEVQWLESGRVSSVYKNLGNDVGTVCSAKEVDGESAVQERYLAGVPADDRGGITPMCFQLPVYCPGREHCQIPGAAACLPSAGPVVLRGLR
ncbi:hypothetical protein RRG08_060018 [Elysia crispata]|uniref:Uncharacterized protein n=1 Tax=Elysia crispata TaxID=231223 RepID=A0AAE0YDX3_9GAST|nr:hypothetical protein RRG08_060018 [Elysia crispata]